MPILGSSNSAANENKWKIIWLSRKHCWKRRNCYLPAISTFPTMFSKPVLLMCQNEYLWSTGLNSVAQKRIKKCWFFLKRGKDCGKKKKSWWSAFSPFPTMFYTLPNKKFYFFSYVYFVICKIIAFDLDESKILLVGKELNICLLVILLVGKELNICLLVKCKLPGWIIFLNQVIQAFFIWTLHKTVSFPYNTDMIVSILKKEDWVNPFPNDKFWTPQNWKSLQRTILNLIKIAESSTKE